MAKEKERLVRVFCEDGDGRMQLNTWPLGRRFDAYSWIDRLLGCTTGREFSFMAENEHNTYHYTPCCKNFQVVSAKTGNENVP